MDFIFWSTASPSRLEFNTKTKQETLAWVCVKFGCVGLWWGGFSAMGSKAQAVLLAAEMCCCWEGRTSTGADTSPEETRKKLCRLYELTLGQNTTQQKKEARRKHMATRSLWGLQSEGEASRGLQPTELFPGRTSHAFTASSANMKRGLVPCEGPQPPHRTKAEPHIAFRKGMRALH